VTIASGKCHVERYGGAAVSDWPNVGVYCCWIYIYDQCYISKSGHLGKYSGSWLWSSQMCNFAERWHAKRQLLRLQLRPRVSQHWSTLVNIGHETELIKKTYQFINVVNGMSHSHETANIFFHLTQ